MDDRIAPSQIEPEVVIQALKKARGLIGGGWIQFDLAQSEYGEPVHTKSDKACRFCLVGGLSRAAGGDGIVGDPLFSRMYSELYSIIGENLSDWNDGSKRTKEEVLALIDEAIEKQNAH